MTLIFRTLYLYDMEFSIFFFFLQKLEYMSGLPGFCRYHNNSFAIWFCTIHTWFMPIFMSRIPESGFLSGSPVFQKVHIWNLHVMRSFWMQKFSRTNFVPESGFDLNSRFFNFFPYNFFCGLLWSSIACSGLLLNSLASQRLLPAQELPKFKKLPEFLQTAILTVIFIRIGRFLTIL